MQGISQCTLIGAVVVVVVVGITNCIFRMMDTKGETVQPSVFFGSCVYLCDAV